MSEREGFIALNGFACGFGLGMIMLVMVVWLDELFVRRKVAP